MIAAAISFAVSFAYIFLKATQQLNVVHGRYWLVWPVSLAMGVCEVAIVLYVVRENTLWLGVANGAGAGIGAILAMRLHQFSTRKPS